MPDGPVMVAYSPGCVCARYFGASSGRSMKAARPRKASGSVMPASDVTRGRSGRHPTSLRRSCRSPVSEPRIPAASAFCDRPPSPPPPAVVNEARDTERPPLRADTLGARPPKGPPPPDDADTRAGVASSPWPLLPPATVLGAPAPSRALVSSSVRLSSLVQESSLRRAQGSASVGRGARAWRAAAGAQPPGRRTGLRTGERTGERTGRRLSQADPSLSEEALKSSISVPSCDMPPVNSEKRTATARLMAKYEPSTTSSTCRHERARGKGSRAAAQRPQARRRQRGGAPGRTK